MPGYLNGKTILITRASQQALDFKARLEELGAKTIVLPLISIMEPDSWHEADQAIARLESYQWIIFASANAVSAFCRRLADQNLDPRQCLKHLKIACVGASTNKALQIFQLSAQLVAADAIAEGLWQELSQENNLKDLRLLWPRTNIGRDYLKEKLTAAGAYVEEINVYKTGGPENPQAAQETIMQLLRDRKLHAITLMSGQTAANLALLIPEASKNALLQDVLIASIGPQTSESARAHLKAELLEAKTHNSEGLITALLDYYQDHPSS